MSPSAVPVDWEIATDPRMQQVIQRCTEEADPRFAHSLHVECRGLEPGREYWYRFIAGGEASPTGRLRTAPARGAALDRLRFGFVSCAHYELGYFSAYRHLADEDPDLVLFLGDYIYEYIAGRGKVRQHSDGVEATDLRTYRNRHAQYKTDRTCGPCMHPSRVSRPGTTMRYITTTPTTARRISTIPSTSWRAARRRIRRIGSTCRCRFGRGRSGPDATLFDRADFGDLATFLLADGRQYRSPRPAIFRRAAAARRWSTPNARSASTRAALISARDRKPGCTASSAAPRRAGTSSRRDS